MKSEKETEQLIFESMPHSPVELRQLIDQQVRSSLRRQIRINDGKWLGLTFGSLVFVLVSIWFISRSAQVQLQEFCRTEVSSPETARFLVAYFGNSKISLSETMAPRDSQETNIPET